MVYNTILIDSLHQLLWKGVELITTLRTILLLGSEVKIQATSSDKILKEIYLGSGTKRLHPKNILYQGIETKPHEMQFRMITSRHVSELYRWQCFHFNFLCEVGSIRP